MAATAEQPRYLRDNDAARYRVLEIVPPAYSSFASRRLALRIVSTPRFVRKVSIGGVRDSTCAVAQVRELAAVPPVGELHVVKAGQTPVYETPCRTALPLAASVDADA